MAIKKKAAARKAKDKRARKFDVSWFGAMVENAPTNLIFADPDFVIRYMNAGTIKTLKELQAYLPVKVEDMIGQSVDVFHKTPEHQRRILSDPKNLPHRADIRLGPEQLDLLVSPIFDSRGRYVGPMLSWE